MGKLSQDAVQFPRLSRRLGTVGSGCLETETWSIANEKYDLLSKLYHIHVELLIVGLVSKHFTTHNHLIEEQTYNWFKSSQTEQYSVSYLNPISPYIILKKTVK